MKTHTQNNEQLNFDKVWQMFQETREQMKETDKKLDKMFQDTDKKINKLSDFYGNLSKNIGESVEEFFYNSFQNNPKIGNIKFRNVVQYMKTDKVEYDIVLTNGRYIAVIEIKHKFHPNDIEKFLETRISLLRKEFPKFDKCKIIVGIAGFVIPKSTQKIALEKGLYIFTQSGDSIKTLNPLNFKHTNY